MFYKVIFCPNVVMTTTPYLTGEKTVDLKSRRDQLDFGYHSLRPLGADSSESNGLSHSVPTPAAFLI